nr:hypothetical protein [Tanacetum cinerariifolium]
RGSGRSTCRGVVLECGPGRAVVAGYFYSGVVVSIIVVILVRKLDFGRRVASEVNSGRYSRGRSSSATAISIGTGLDVRRAVGAAGIGVAAKASSAAGARVGYCEAIGPGIEGSRQGQGWHSASVGRSHYRGAGARADGSCRG